MRIEAKVGLFVVLGFLVLLGLSTQLNSVRALSHEGYKLYVKIDDATGLKEQAHVKMSGVDIGLVEAITLKRGQVVLVLSIKKDIEIPSDSTVILTQESMLGSKVVNIEPGNSIQTLQAEQTVSNSKNYASFEQTSQKVSEAADEFNELMDSANNVLDQQRQDELKQTIDDLAIVMRDIKELIKDNKTLVNTTLRHYDELATEFVKTGKELNSWLPEFEHKANNLVQTYDQAGDDLSQLITTNSKPLNKTIVDTGEFFESGKNMVARLDRFLSSVVNSELEMSVYDRYLLNDNTHKIFAGLTYRPNPSSSYQVEIASDDDFTKTDDNTTTGNYVAPVKHEEGNYWVTVLYGKRYGDLNFKVGLMESHGGFGIDYYLDHDRWRLSADFYDFSAKNDWRSESLRLNLTARYTYLDHLDFYIGIDNLLNFNNVYTQDLDGDPTTTNDRVNHVGNYNFMVGLGVHFVDDNLKTLLGFTGIPNVQ